MMKFNLDVCTTRRISGWIFNINDEHPVDELYIACGEKRVAINLIERPDVAEAFSLTHTKLGIEINIPDAFDSTVNDYKIFYKSQELFSYKAQYERLLHPEKEAPSSSTEDSHRPNYKKGRHILFLYETEYDREQLDAFSKPMIRRSFPKIISGCEFSFEHINSLSDFKKDLLDNLKNILLIVPSALYSKIHRTSPTLIDSGKFVTLYSGGNLTSRTGLHEHQLNNFIVSKTRTPEELPTFKSSVARIWAAVENYADLIFSSNENLFFMVSLKGEASERINKHISNKIQNKRNEDIIRIHSEQTEVILLNISAYSKMFDCIGNDRFWGMAIKRGLKHSTLVI